LAEIPARLGFEKPTAVQSDSLPAALAGESFVAVAPTGTGKTFVYLLPLWSRLPSRHGNLILVPTRELGYQVSQMLQQIDARARDGLVLCLGGHDVDSQRRRLAAEWHTLIATPGRLLDLLSTDPGLLRSIRFLVLDEFDRLIDMGFEEQVGGILSKVPKKRQTLLFSATGAEDALGRLPLGALEPPVLRGVELREDRTLTEHRVEVERDAREPWRPLRRILRLDGCKKDHRADDDGGCHVCQTGDVPHVTGA
jgi:superfamily II DNA/RNA helicase